MIKEIVNSFVDSFLFKLEYIKTYHWEKVKWIINAFYIAATLVMINPELASKSIVPWVLFLIGNIIWMIDSVMLKNIPWIWMAGFFVVWDTILILSRIYGWGIGG